MGTPTAADVPAAPCRARLRMKLAKHPSSAALADDYYGWDGRSWERARRRKPAACAGRAEGGLRDRLLAGHPGQFQVSDEGCRAGVAGRTGPPGPAGRFGLGGHARHDHRDLAEHPAGGAFGQFAERAALDLLATSWSVPRHTAARRPGAVARRRAPPSGAVTRRTPSCGVHRSVRRTCGRAPPARRGGNPSNRTGRGQSRDRDRRGDGRRPGQHRHLDGLDRGGSLEADAGQALAFSRPSTSLPAVSAPSRAGRGPVRHRRSRSTPAAYGDAERGRGEALPPGVLGRDQPGGASGGRRPGRGVTRLSEWGGRSGTQPGSLHSPADPSGYTRLAPICR